MRSAAMCDRGVCPCVSVCVYSIVRVSVRASVREHPYASHCVDVHVLRIQGELPYTSSIMAACVRACMRGGSEPCVSEELADGHTGWFAMITRAGMRK